MEKEFTRRCQRLSKLEKELSDTTVKDETPAEWKGKVDKFFNENPQAKPLARAIAEEIVKDGALRKRKDCLARRQHCRDGIRRRGNSNAGARLSKWTLKCLEFLSEFMG